MSAVYPFRLGNLECVVLLDGMSILGVEGMLKRYAAATEAEYRQAFEQMGLRLEEAQSSLNILVVKMGGQTLLVDAGQGGKGRGGDLPAHLQQAGFAPEDITLVIVTHTHIDHIQGLVREDNSPVFPRATYIMAALEDQARRATGTPDQIAILEMMAHQGLRLIEMDEVIMPGLHALPIPGHTPGQIALLFESAGDRLLHMADLLHSPMQLRHPEWSPTFDADPELAARSRRAMLARAADENLRVIFYHLPFPGLGYIRRAAAGFGWEALS